MLHAVTLGLARLRRNEKGNVAVLFGLAVIPIMLAVGAAVDYGRALSVKSRMSDAADASALAIGSWTGLNDAQLKVKAQQFFDANYPESSLGTAGKLNVKFVGDDIHVDVSGSVPTTFMKLANINSVDVGASAVITKNQRNIELALVLDTTGSMGQGGKMWAMQNAAKKLVQDLFQDNSTSDTVKIAVVPFAGAVNVGSDKKNENWIDKNAKSDVSWEDFKKGVKVFDLYDDLRNRKWEGCVRERDGDAYELTDATPTTGTPASLFAPYLAPDEPDDNDDGANYANDYIDDQGCGNSGGGGGGGWGGWGWGGGGWGGGSDGTPNECQRYTGKYRNASANADKGPQFNCPPGP